jgi:hypothetical protein
MTRIMHHGSVEGAKEFEPRYTGTDYFNFFHKPCANKEHQGFSDIYAFLIDEQGRLIFNFKCKDCGAINALRTHTDWDNDKITIEHIYLSPSLKQRIGKHSWDKL